MEDKKTDPLAEITAMQQIAGALAALDGDAIARILRWTADRYGVRIGVTSAATKGYEGGTSGERETTINSPLQFGELADLYNAASPTTDADKALVAAYWFQYAEEKPDLAAQDINTALKHLGHGVSNITDAFDSLMTKKPALVMQVKKSGTTRQARKKYKVTTSGKAAVEAMIEQHQ